MAQKKNDVVCCALCGRDTANQSMVCTYCYGNRTGEEMRGRKARPSRTLGGTPLIEAFEEGESEPTAAEAYHGGSIRDDL